MNSKALVFMVILALGTGLEAVKVKQIEKTNLADFQKGTFTNVSIDNTGRLFLGPKLKIIPGPAEEFYLSAAAAKNGDLYLGTGHNACGVQDQPDRENRSDFQGRAAGRLCPARGRQWRRDRRRLRPTAGCTGSPRRTRSANCSIPTKNSSGTWPKTSRAISSAPWAIPAPCTSISKAGTVENLFMAEDSPHRQPACHPGQRHPGRQRRPRHPLRDQEPQGQGPVRFSPG